METVKEYKANYNRGWRTDQGAKEFGGLERADARGEPDSWYEGYEDSAAHRNKWHSLYCENHCGEASPMPDNLRRPEGCGERGAY